MDLVKSLKDKKQKSAQETQGSLIVSNAKLLLAGGAAEDARIMNGLSNNSNFSRIQDEVGKQINLENLDKKFGDVFHINDIKDLCIKYKLRFLNSRKYTGDIDVVVVQKIKEFAANNPTVSVDDYSLRENFFIMAPANLFALQKKVIVKAEDPVIFYRIDHNHYRLIHKWGNDFSIFRRFLGWKWANANNYSFYWFLVGISVGSFAFNFFMPLELSIGSLGPIFFLSCIIGVVFLFCARFSKSPGDTVDDDYFTEENWDSQHYI